MSAEITSACRAEDARPWGATAEERGSLGTLSWPRAAKIAGLAGAVAILTAMSIAAGHMARVPGPPDRAHTVSVISTQAAPAPALKPLPSGGMPAHAHDPHVTS